MINTFNCCKVCGERFIATYTVPVANICDGCKNDILWVIRKDLDNRWRCNITKCSMNYNRYCLEKSFEITGICPQERTTRNSQVGRQEG